ncbi:hypothetical protein BDZ45DRAFT_98285 [Acephala macrosclerotiorum]|nr:hypothetical protein BDZ45DRAFT_98285 [Acephala macrosclerotiorum]
MCSSSLTTSFNLHINLFNSPLIHLFEARTRVDRTSSHFQLPIWITPLTTIFYSLELLFPPHNRRRAHFNPVQRRAMNHATTFKSFWGVSKRNRQQDNTNKKPGTPENLKIGPKTTHCKFKRASKPRCSQQVQIYSKIEPPQSQCGTRGPPTPLHTQPINQVTAPLSLFPKLPAELHMMIFEDLGPASQRILSSTCKSLYSIWKKSYWNKAYYQRRIIINMDELLTKGSSEYRCILGSWIVPLKARNDPLLSCKSVKLQMEWESMHMLGALERVISKAKLRAEYQLRESSTAWVKRHGAVIKFEREVE